MYIYIYFQGCGAAEGEVASALLQHVWNAYAGGAAAQAPENGALLQEHGDAGKTEGYGGRKSVS